MTTCLDDSGKKIVRELCGAVERLCHDAGRLACIGSWATPWMTPRSSIC
jgi:hypothetical protein